MWVEHDVNGAGVVIFIENFLPVLAAIQRPIHAAIRIGSIGVPKSGHVDDVRVARVNDKRADMLGTLQADVCPGLPAIGGFINSISV